MIQMKPSKQSTAGQVVSAPCRIGDLELLSLISGEWLNGYCGRIARFNSLKPTLREVTSHLHQAVAPNSSAPAALIPAFSKAAGIDVLTVLLNHTMWPAIRATNRPSGPEILELLADPETRTVFSKPARREEWFCPACASEDMASLHFSFWRRDHQLPGSFRCNAHGCALSATERNSAIKHMPHELAVSNALPISGKARSLLNDLFAQRASDIANAINSGRLNLEVEDVATLLLARAAMRLELEADAVSPDDVKALLRRHVKSKWGQLALQYGSSQARDRFAFADRLLFGNYGAISGAAVAIVAAALFQSTDDAIAALTRLSTPIER